MGRRLGQHFLADPAILDRVVQALNPTPEDTLIEIGPGRGTLTERLLPAVSRVLAVERDPTLARELAERKLPGLTVITGDALGEDWHRLAAGPGMDGREGEGEAAGEAAGAGAGAGQHFKVVGNVPYYITTPLIDKALAPPLPELVVFMIQKEVALRLASDPATKAYGALTVGVRAVARVERLFDVRAGSFRPPPRVDSSVVRFTPLLEPLVSPDEQAPFRQFTAALFSRRRKQLGRSLRAISGVGAGSVEEALSALGIAADGRAETLGVPEIVSLFRAFRDPSLTG